MQSHYHVQFTETLACFGLMVVQVKLAPDAKRRISHDQPASTGTVDA